MRGKVSAAMRTFWERLCCPCVAKTSWDSPCGVVPERPRAAEGARPSAMGLGVLGSTFTTMPRGAEGGAAPPAMPSALGATWTTTGVMGAEPPAWALPTERREAREESEVRATLLPVGEARAMSMSGTAEGEMRLLLPRVSILPADRRWLLERDMPLSAGATGRDRMHDQE